ncbi:hypothetical protein OsJ_06405 [Oryza sativa Japonica Group]|uniref:Disease resistance protein winged helix domain-containing protein n=1 Tax=Oryza sativa subsp. japonica TaxID=39947 RepID=B9F582_ORYSJ|nr:hypothetical protein OsJ_06405 [Oryza sativa Japonica Group]
MGTLESHNLACLSDDDSWELFSKKAFNKGVQQQVELVTAGKLIVKKCKGLPLALKTMGDMMSSKQQVKEWETIARSNTGDNDRGEDDILPVLKLSYRHLPPEMKQCFAFCSVFPKDHEMDKEVLIQLWMANGFIQEDETMGLEQKGEYVFRNLVWRSFLQDVKQERGFGRRWRGWVSALLLTAETRIDINGTLSDPFKPMRGLRQGDPLSPLLFVLVMDTLHAMLQKAMSAGLLDKVNQWSRAPNNSLYADDAVIFFKPCLTTLHFSNCSGCKDLSTVWFLVSIECMSLSKMENLTTLFMNVVGVKAEGYYIPLQIFPRLKDMTLSQLSNLEKWTESTAGEANTSLVTFPKLATLCISDCPKLASVPDCSVLKELKTYGYCSLAMSLLAHLTTLSELIYRENESMRMSLGSWPSLTKLHISSSYNQMATLEVDTNQGPLENLRILRLYGLNFFTAASGLSKMHLGLWKCFAFVEDLCIGACNDLVHWPMEELMSLIHLRSLSIEHCDNLEGKGSSSEEIMPLYYLEKFHIKDCKSLLDIPTMPASLEELCLLLCPRLVALPSNLGNLARLKTMSFEHCHDLKELPDGMDGLISLEELKIMGVPRDREISTGSPPSDSDPSIPNGSRLP